VALSCCLGGAGCTTLAASLQPGDKPPVGPVQQVTAVWETRIYSTMDPVHGGDTLPCLAGRLFLFGPDGSVPLAGDGELLVRLFSDDVLGPDGQPKELEKWLFHNAQLKLLLHKDIVGWGYTLVLPWATYSPAVTHVHFRVAYQPKGKTPLFCPSGPLTLKHPERPQPGGGPPVAAAPPPRPAPAPAPALTAAPSAPWQDRPAAGGPEIRQTGAWSAPGR
jgi:hypothetical protein